MLRRKDNVDAHVLDRGSWTIYAIARNLGHDRKTSRIYLRGGLVAGQRRSSSSVGVDPFVDYCRCM
jgi:hypothetical protein